MQQRNKTTKVAVTCLSSNNFSNKVLRNKLYSSYKSSSTSNHVKTAKDRRKNCYFFFFNQSDSSFKIPFRPLYISDRMHLFKYKMNRNYALLDACGSAGHMAEIQRQSITEKDKKQTSSLTEYSANQNVMQTQRLAGDSRSISASDATYNMRRESWKQKEWSFFFCSLTYCLRLILLR